MKKFNLVSIGLTMAFAVAVVGCGKGSEDPAAANAPSGTPVAPAPPGSPAPVAPVAPVAGSVPAVNGYCQPGYILQTDGVTCAPYTQGSQTYCNNFPGTAPSQQYNYGCYGAGQMPNVPQGTGYCSWVYTGQTYVCYPGNGYNNGQYAGYYGYPQSFGNSLYGQQYGCYWTQGYNIYGQYVYKLRCQ